MSERRTNIPLRLLLDIIREWKAQRGGKCITLGLKAFAIIEQQYPAEYARAVAQGEADYARRSKGATNQIISLWTAAGRATLKRLMKESA